MTFPFQEEGFSPMHVSAWEGDEQVIKYLNQVKANPNIVDKVRSLLNPLKTMHYETSTAG